MSPMLSTLVLSVSLALAATADAANLAKSTSADPDRADEEIMTSASFLSSHPDLRHRLLGLHAYAAGDDAEAFENFRRAARYADKPSQAMVAEMYWVGRGVEKNRALGFVWMELASERGYKVMLAQRQRFLADLSEVEREEAVRLSRELFAEYGDAVAKPRMERQLRWGSRNTAGSRTGFVGNMQIRIPGPYGDITVDGSQFFAEKFWKPEAYWTWQAEDWKELPKARVDVGPLKSGTKAADD
jgi:hypothetical protein